MKAVDLERARRNIERYNWAKDYVRRLREGGDAILERLTPEYLEQMIERTTPGCVGPCPACRAQGLPWHPNGQWTWSSASPDELTCKVCETVFPNDEFPESIVVRSTWDPEQEFGLVGGETFKCFGYHNARPSLTGIIRARKVGYASGQMRNLAITYALTGDAEYARGTKAFLLRLAEVFPKYLVRAGYGYGEYTDCDPHLAAEHIADLPTDELVYPPNKPDRKLYAGYWAASRIGSSGMDGGWVSGVAQAYDLTCTAEDENGPVYSEEERIRIERDVLLEGSYLAACDSAINNKSVGNRAGAAMVGMVVGHPGLVRFGLEGFERTVDGWFLPDGGSSESPAYAMMTMGGIRNFGLMFRDYSEPQGYTAPDGTRLDGFDACRDTRYGDCWQDLIWTLQGNLKHPPSADSYRTTGISSTYAELIAVGYPTDEHLAFLREIVTGDPSGGAAQMAILYREPGIEEREVAPFSLPDIVFPYLAQGYLRTGELGRDSALLLNASDWGGHHHIDSLDLYYWQDGRELLSDLGYLWDHPDKHQTTRALAHNLVLIDGADQQTRNRGGSFHLFATAPAVKAMEASSSAYAAASEYRRTCVQVDHGDAGSYVVDIFRVDADAPKQYVFHGPGNDYQVEGLALGPARAAERKARFAVRFHLPQVSEVFVDDVEIIAEDGTDLAPNPSAAEEPVDGKPPGWGQYVGEGAAEHAVAEPGRTDARCMRFAATRPHENGKVNSALLVGDSDGYRGPDAIEGVLGTTCTLRFWLRGDAPHVNVNVVLWPNDPGSPDDRKHVTVMRVAATDEWTRYEGEFTLPSSSLPITNAQSASGETPWSATWLWEDGYRFAAMSPGQPGETVTIGDGWGQRDHRNSDVGATLPYIVRETKEAGPTAFVSVFAGAPEGKALVQAVRLLDAPEGAVAAEVETTEGTDVLVSMVEPKPVTIATTLGQLETDARLAVAGASGTVLVGGTRLSVGDTELTQPGARYEGEIVDMGGARGESYFAAQGELPEGIVGQTLLVRDGDFVRAYIIRGMEPDGAVSRIYTKRDGVGFEAKSGEAWEFLATAVGQ